MLRTFRALIVLSLWAAATRAAAQEPAPADPKPAPSDAAFPAEESEVEETAPAKPAEKPSPEEPESAPTGAAPPGTTPPAAEPTEPKSAAESEGFRTFVTGYFRAPMAMGVSPRKDPGDESGPDRTQISYGPNRTVDSNYYSFAYTRLQEQDWVEVFFHAKKKHVEAVVGWMGYWFQSAGFRNYDAGWVPGMAYLTLDTDVAMGEVKPNVALTAGAFWPSFGYFDKYDTYTLGRFRHVGEQLKLTAPITRDLTVTLVQGFGTGRDGSFNILSPPPYQAAVGLDLLHYEHVRVAFRDNVDVGFHFNHQWTRDPNLTQRGSPGQAYADAREAKFTTVGGEVHVRAPYAGHLWVSPSYTRVRNGWALAQAGTEVMHSLGGAGFATNYMAWDESATNSTGTGSTFNLGFLYENSLSSLLGKERGAAMPEVTLNVFGLFIDSNLDLPATSVIPQDHIAQMKYGADVTVQPLKWLGFMLRWDEVNYNLDDTGYVFSAITPRIILSSNFLSSESVYIQYSRYRYGDKMVVAGRWPWGQPLVAGSTIVQGGPYAGETPDMDVIKLQANVSF
jgi:hypothetical protein